MSAIGTLRRHLRPIRRLVKATQTRLVELPYLLQRPSLGTADWLIRTEVFYGGYVTDVVRRRVSNLDGRSAEQLASGGMTGGDRMLHHGYAPAYSHYLMNFFGVSNLTITEFGILRGTGLAIWCDLFPEARVMGLDIDLGHFESNRAALEQRGAFKRNKPELHEYDQLISGEGRLRQILDGRTLDVVIDDGLHSPESIITTWRSTLPFLSPRFAYIIEDYAGLIDEMGQEFDGYDCRPFGMLTVVSRGLPTG